METPSISRRLAKFIKTISFEELPKDVIERTKILILDALSTTIAGHNSTYVKIGLELVKNNKGNTTIFTYDYRVPAIDATFINSLLANSIGQDDMQYKSHPGAIVVPTSLTLAEQEGSSGSDVITAVVAGYDIIGRIYLGAPSIIPRFRGIPVLGPFGAAATAGKLLQLEEDKLTNALCYAANFSSGFTEGLISGFMEPKFHTGMASRNGVTAAILAQAGAKASEKTLEGKAGFYQAFAGTNEGLDLVTSELGKKFLIMDTTYKPYPICGFLQTTLDALLSLVKQHNISGAAIKKVIQTEPEEIYFYPGNNYDGPFTSRIQALMSAKFITAAALLGKPVTSHTFYDNYNDSEVAELIDKIELTKERGRDKTKIEVILQSGKKYSTESLGKELIIPTNDRIKLKFERLASGFLEKKKRNRIIDIVINLDKFETIDELIQELK
jgi:2-methylcitrate dehydratase PrpD